MKCGKCGELGKRADGCGTTHNVGGAKQSSDDDSEEERSVSPIAASSMQNVNALPPTPSNAVPPLAPIALPASKPKLELAKPQHEDRVLTSEPAWVADVRQRLAPPNLHDGHLHDGHEPMMRAPLDGLASRAGTSTRDAEEKLRREGGAGNPRGESPLRAVVATQPTAAGDTCSASAASSPSNLIPIGRAVRRRRREDLGLTERATTIAEKTGRELAAKQVAYILGLDDQADADDVELRELATLRPKTRGDCLAGGTNEARPCAWLACRYHLAIEVTGSGSLQVIRNVPLEQLEHTCTLDLADRADAAPDEPDELGRHRNHQFAMTLEEVGQVLNVTRERIRQVETKALMGAKASARFYGLGNADAEFDHPTYGEENYR